MHIFFLTYIKQYSFLINSLESECFAWDNWGFWDLDRSTQHRWQTKWWVGGEEGRRASVQAVHGHSVNPKPINSQTSVDPHPRFLTALFPHLQLFLLHPHSLPLGFCLGLPQHQGWKSYSRRHKRHQVSTICLPITLTPHVILRNRLFPVPLSVYSSWLFLDLSPGAGHPDTITTEKKTGVVLRNHNSVLQECLEVYGTLTLLERIPLLYGLSVGSSNELFFPFLSPKYIYQKDTVLPQICINLRFDLRVRNPEKIIPNHFIVFRRISLVFSNTWAWGQTELFNLTKRLL